MRQFSSEFSAHLNSGATTLCWCWRLIRADGVVLGFTDHDVSISFGGQSYEPAGGLEGSEQAERLGAQTQTSDVMGILRSDAIADDDITLGRYDGARVESWRVNWRAVEQRALIRVDTIGEITREDGVFRAELRSGQHAINIPKGRLYQHMCDARLGDGRCGVNLDQSVYRTQATVVTVAGRSGVTVGGLDGYAANWFAQGTAVWLSGRRAGVTDVILRHDSGALGFAEQVGDWVTPGDTLRLTAGCDKQFDTCRTKFFNGPNFQGFPHIPGTDALLRYPASDERMDGAAVAK